MLNDLDKLQLHCTDRNEWVDAYILSRRDQSFIEVAVNTVKVHLAYRKKPNGQGGVYVGNMAGLEFVIDESVLPAEWEMPANYRHNKRR